MLMYDVACVGVSMLIGVLMVLTAFASRLCWRDVLRYYRFVEGVESESNRFRSGICKTCITTFGSGGVRCAEAGGGVLKCFSVFLSSKLQTLLTNKTW